MQGLSRNVRVLIVDDDRMAVETLSVFVAANGFETLAAYDGETALEIARERAPEVVLLDVMLPKIDGFEVCKRLREFSDAAVLMLTAKTFAFDRVRGLEGGADDYILKPYGLSEVVARIRAVLRRTKPTVGTDNGAITVGNARIDLHARTVVVDGARLALTPTQFRLLSCLAQSAGMPISRDELIDRVLGTDYEGLDRTIDVHVASLRKRLSASPNIHIAIATVFGVGYALETIA